MNDKRIGTVYAVMILKLYSRKEYTIRIYCIYYTSIVYNSTILFFRHFSRLHIYIDQKINK